MVIRMRHTRAHTKNRRSHHGLKTPTVAKCGNCGENHQPHHMCLACGFYNGTLVIDMKAKHDAREARMTAKREARKGEADTAEEENAIPGAVDGAAPDMVDPAKQEVVDAPEVTKTKKAAPRKEQSA